MDEAIRMRVMNRRAPWLLPAALMVPLLTVACGSETTILPAGLGPAALVTDVDWPAACTSATGTGGAIAIGAANGIFGTPSYTERQARACVPYDLAAVWHALQVPSGVDVGFWPEATESDCEASVNVEPGYAVSFLTKEIPHGGIQSHYTFDITWRADVTQGTTAAPGEVRMFYGKTAGTVEVPWIRGSMIFSVDPVNPKWTRIELVRQINTNGHSDEPLKLTNWMQAYYDGLMTQLSTGTLTPKYCALP
jgi:hypothetical protein